MGRIGSDSENGDTQGVNIGRLWQLRTVLASFAAQPCARQRIFSALVCGGLSGLAAAGAYGDGAGALAAAVIVGPFVTALDDLPDDVHAKAAAGQEAHLFGAPGGVAGGLAEFAQPLAARGGQVVVAG